MRAQLNLLPCRWLVQAAQWAKDGLPKDLVLPEYPGTADLQVRSGAAVLMVMMRLLRQRASAAVRGSCLWPRGTRAAVRAGPGCALPESRRLWCQLEVSLFVLRAEGLQYCPRSPHPPAAGQPWRHRPSTRRSLSASLCCTMRSPSLALSWCVKLLVLPPVCWSSLMRLCWPGPRRCFAVCVMQGAADRGPAPAWRS